MFLRAWVPVHPRKFYIPVTNLLQENKTDWQGMRRVGEVRREQAIKTPRNPDSEYKVRGVTKNTSHLVCMDLLAHRTIAGSQPIVRTERRFSPLVIPKALQAALPFASKVHTSAKPCDTRRHRFTLTPRAR